MTVPLFPVMHFSLNMASNTAKWETVSHKKKATVADKKAAKKALSENRPTIDTAPPLQQSATIYNVAFNGVRQTPNKESSREETAKSHQQQSKKTAPKKKIEKKDERFKSLDEALKVFDVSEMQALFNDVQNKFPDSPLLWLKDLVTFMNLKLNVKDGDPVFGEQPLDYPLCKVGNTLKKLLISALNKCSTNTLHLFFEFCVHEMISDRNKNLSSYGYRIYLQSIAFERPDVVIENIPKLLELIKKKQNGPASCLSIMWSVGQAGHNDFAAGLRVWIKVMFPQLSSKALANYALTYLGDLFSQHKDRSPGYEVMGPNEFFPIMDFIFTPNNGLSTSPQLGLQKKLLGYYPKLKALAFGETPATNLRNYFPSLLARTTISCPASLKTELLSCLTLCLSADNHCFSEWCQMYTSHMEQSSVLMNHLLFVWDQASKKIPKKPLRDTIRAFSVTNEELTAKSNQYEHLNACRAACKELIAKMTGTTFPWRTLVFLIMSGIIALVTIDMYTHRGYAGSRTALALENSGLESASLQAWNKITVYAGRANNWTQENVPYYYAKACEFSEPYLQLLWEKLYQLGVYIAEVTEPQRKWLNQKVPLLLEWIQDQLPVVTDTIKHYVIVVWSVIYHYSMVVWETISPYLFAAGTWLQENIFTGKLSQESIRHGIHNTWTLVQNYTVAFTHWCSQALTKESAQ
ncbi:transmembrane protein 214-B-like [Ptychodera flava]|uniref:transmembrane protein 214-B-like n=1 Tax=Ptychodera flava TaxID=63121 RepID=UPI00396A50BC